MESNQLIKMTDLKQLGLQLKGAAPSDSNKTVTKSELNTYFYINPANEPIASYPNNRLITILSLGKSLFQKPGVPFYQYDVTRSGIPNAEGAFFTYVAPDFTTQTIVEDNYGYIGRFCMQDGSYRNNQWNVYSISEVGICFPNFGNTYPQPLNPQYRSGSLQFTSVYGYAVHNIKLFKRESFECGSQDGFNPFKDFACLIKNIIDVFTGEENMEITNVLKYSQDGLYTNGSLSLNQFNPGLYFITYDVVNIFGGVTVFQYLDTSQSPSFSLIN
jgi:hypothetical protein